MPTKNKKLKQFEIEFRGTTYRSYIIKAECKQLAKLIAWEDMNDDEDSSWHWKQSAEITQVDEYGKEPKPF